jgi:acyl-coenzyme A thioesterase PaaI-like protein
MEERRTDHYPFCWGCSIGLEGGLGFDWRLAGGRLEADHVFSERFQSAPGMVHDGIVSALLAEACAQVARVAISPAAISRFELACLAPVPVDAPVRVAAELTAVNGRRVTAESSLHDESGMLLAHAIAELAQVRPEHFLSTPQGRLRGVDWLDV